MSKVLIMLSTYNGEKYLSEQLNSLYAQEGVDIHMLVRDDGSRDATVDILNEYKKKYGKMTILIGRNVGVSRSYYQLINYAYHDMESFDYYSFCDQDDVWYNDKLEKSSCLINSKTSSPELFYGPAISVDANLKPIKHVESKIVNCLSANVASNHSLGCTQVFNRALLERIIRINDYCKCHGAEAYYPLHDAWTALVAYALGTVIVGNEPLMLYRQHGDNVVGSGTNAYNNLINRIRRNSTNKCIKSCKCRILLELFSAQIPDKNRTFIEKCAYYNENIVKCMTLVLTKEIYHYGIINSVGTFFVILLRKF